MKQLIDTYFSISEKQSSWSIELRAGVTTFLTMAYILFVNPAILSDAIQVPDASAQLLTATAVAAAFGTLVMGFYARLPFAMAPGMGLNAYFAYTVVQGQAIAWPTALGAVFISGCVFLLISVTGLRTAIVNMIPRDLKLATAAGIGIFLAFIGLKNAGLIIDHPVTFVTLGDVHLAGPALALLGLFVTAALIIKRIPGAILIGVALCSTIAIAFQAPVFQDTPFAGFSGAVIQWPNWPAQTAFQLDIMAAFKLGLGSIVFIFFFVDFFDTAGTLIGLTQKLKLSIDDNQISRAFSADALATMFGACVGVSTTTSYIESAAGVEEGGKTGLTAIVTGLCFLSAIFIWPLATAVPACATAPALILVGSMMVTVCADIEWSNMPSAFPAFVTMITIPLSFSIANGISFGLISYCILAFLSGRGRDLHPGLYIMTALLVARYLFFGLG